MTFKQWWKAFLGIHDWMNPKLIPRRRGYQFVAKLKDDVEAECQIVGFAGLLGDHFRVWSPEIGHIKFDQILAWRER